MCSNKVVARSNSPTKVLSQIRANQIASTWRKFGKISSSMAKHLASYLQNFEIIDLEKIMQVDHSNTSYSRTKLMAELFEKADIEKVQFSHLEMLAAVLPTNGEQKLILSEFDAGCTSFRDVEQKFILPFIHIDNPQERLKLLLFAMNMKGKANDIISKFEKFSMACKQLKTSMKLKKFYAMVLALGRTINNETCSAG